jgi:hypothetical protein
MLIPVLSSDMDCFFDSLQYMETSRSVVYRVYSQSYTNTADLERLSNMPKFGMQYNEIQKNNLIPRPKFQ